MGYCRASAVHLLEQELLSKEYKTGLEAVNVAISKSKIKLDRKEKQELTHVANEQIKNNMILQYFL